MTITVQNYKQQRSSFDLKNVNPDILEMFNAIDEDFNDYMPLYVDPNPKNKDIRDTIDAHLELVNSYIVKDTPAKCEIKKPESNIIVASVPKYEFKKEAKELPAPKAKAKMTALEKEVKKYQNQKVSIYERMYNKLLKLFPDLEETNTRMDYDIYKKQKISGYDEFAVESFVYNKGQRAFIIAHYYTQNGDLMSAPRMDIRVDFNLKTVEALTYEAHNTMPQVYQEVYADNYTKVNLKAKKSQNDFLNQWLSNLINQGFKIELLNKKESKLSNVVKKYDLLFTNAGGYTVVSNKLKEVRGDYETVAHLSDPIKYFIKDLPANVIAEIEKHAKVKTNEPAPVKKAIKEVVNKENVNFYNNEFVLIRRFYNIVKVKTTTKFRAIQLLYMAFEKAAIARKVRKTSSDADLFTQCNEKLVKVYKVVNESGKDANINFADKDLLKELEKFVKGKQVDPAVGLLNRVINMQGIAPEDIKVERLVKAIDAAIKSKRVTENNRLFNELELAKAELKKYLDGNIKIITPKAQGLSGAKSKKKKVVSKKQSKKKPVLKRSLKEPKQTITVMMGATPTIKKAEPAAEILKREFSAAPLILQQPQKPLPLQFNDNKIETPKKITSRHNLKPISEAKTTVNEYYHIAGDVALMLGKIEKKPIHSVAVTLDAPQGAGKTRAVFQIMNEFADKGYQCLFASLEEHPESSLFKEKVKQYIAPKNQKNIFAIGDLENGYESLAKLIPSFDVIFIDSWNKVAEMSKVDFDTDLRKKYNGKLFVAIFQRTQDGKMRGGSKAQFDGDVVLKIKKCEDFRDNYIFADKNRYQDKPLNEVCYSIYDQQIIPVDALNGAAGDNVSDDDLYKEHVVLM